MPDDPKNDESKVRFFQWLDDYFAEKRALFEKERKEKKTQADSLGEFLGIT